MPKSTSDLKDIVRLGGGINVDAKHTPTIVLKDLATLANTPGAMITIRNADKKLPPDLKDIARLAPGKITFVF